MTENGDGAALPRLEVRPAGAKGQGVFAGGPIRAGRLVAVCRGVVLRGDELGPDHFAMQVGEDLWLCSEGDHLDDRLNHSCDPNVGFVTGAAELYALRDIAAGEEVCWDYSTSLSEAGWGLECGCGSASCRGVVRPFPELAEADRARLRPIALAYIRERW
jgi:hypothetical protein